MKMANGFYTMCKHCSHFVTKNPAYGDYPDIAEYIHLEDGGQEFDHDATPGEIRHMIDWTYRRPDLFLAYKDGKIGPNSKYHVPYHGEIIRQARMLRAKDDSNPEYDRALVDLCADIIWHAWREDIHEAIYREE